IIEPELLAEDRANYLMGIFPVGSAESGQWNRAGLAYVDISTGEFAATELEGENAGVLVVEELARLSPQEVIMPQSWVERGVSFPAGVHLTAVPDWKFEKSAAENVLTRHFQTRTLDGFGLGEMPAAIHAAGAVLQYVTETQRTTLTQLTSLRAYSTASFMV